MFPRRTAASTLVFLDPVIEEMPFPVQRVQTDRSREFFAMAAQQWLMDHCIKFRPNRPASPHLNGKVERSQKTNREEFWAVTDPRTPDVELRLAEWQHHYNWARPHGSLNEHKPIETFCAKQEATSVWDEVESKYDPTGILLPLKLRPPLRHGPKRTEEVARWQQKQSNPLNAGRPNDGWRWW